MIQPAINTNADEPFLAPLERPPNFFMRIAYFFTKRQFGKVITPLKVHSARLPFAFARFYTTIASLDKKLVLDPETVMLIRELVARTNVCHFCIDSNRLLVITESLNLAKFTALDDYKTSPLFSDKDRACLNYVSELTNYKSVDHQTFDHLQEFFSEREICEIVYIIASEHLYNITNIGLNINSDHICELALQK